MTNTLHLGDLAFEVRRSARRKRLGSTVERAGSLVVSAALERPVERITAYMRAKRWWVSRTLAAKELLPPPVVALANAQPNASIPSQRAAPPRGCGSGKTINRNNDKTNDISGVFTLLNHRHCSRLSLFYRFTDLSFYRFREPHHSPGFWQRIERALPEYEASKQWLAEQGAWYAL